MPRRPRVHLAGGCYHVTLRGNHQQNIFPVDGDQRLLNLIVARALDRFQARLHAYCWMNNHLHFLIQVADDPLARPMRQIASEFARAMQAKMHTTGHFFERRYHATLVEAERYLKVLVRYIHLNPVEAGLVTDPSHYPWSSHGAYLGRPHDPWLTTDFVLQNFGSTRELAIRAYGGFMETECVEPWPEDVGGSWDATEILGTEEFIARVRQAATEPNTRQTLPGLISEACKRFGIAAEDLRSAIRDSYLTQVRAWIAHQARTRRIASLAAVSRELCRHEATLRQAMRRYPGEIE